MTRYLCLSKKTGLPDYIVESIAVVTDKEIPPDGYTLLPRTLDSGMLCINTQ
jgi:ESCRT-I complex subunit MVB12